MPIKIDRILSEINKGTVQEQIDAYQKVKDLVSNSIKEQQEHFESEASKLQSTFDKINGQ